MFALRNSVVRVAQSANLMIMPKRTTVVSGPPRTKISDFEKAMHGFVMAVGVCFVPGWVLVHIKDYRGRDES